MAMGLLLIVFFFCPEVIFAYLYLVEVFEEVFVFLIAPKEFKLQKKKKGEFPMSMTPGLPSQGHEGCAQSASFSPSCGGLAHMLPLFPSK